jgi:hypothetical protein
MLWPDLNLISEGTPPMAVLLNINPRANRYGLTNTAVKA